MRTAWLLLALAPLACGGSDPTVFGAVLPSGSVSASSVASTSSAASGSGAGGQGGQGGAVVSSVASGGAGGMGGQGGDPGQGGGGGEPCEPDANPCDGMPDGACGEWVDSCGAAIVCGNEACSPGILACWVDLQACVCQDATGYTLAVNTCAAMGSGVPSFCSDDGPHPDIPATCVDTGVQAPGGNMIWCCD